jgi:hypothetical protein
MTGMKFVVAALVVLGSALVYGQDLTDIPAAAPSAVSAKPEVVDPTPHPALSADPSWTFPVGIMIAGMFIAAAMVGPAVKPAHAEEAVVTAPAHH